MKPPVVDVAVDERLDTSPAELVWLVSFFVYRDELAPLHVLKTDLRERAGGGGGPVGVVTLLAF